VVHLETLPLHCKTGSPKWAAVIAMLLYSFFSLKNMIECSINIFCMIWFHKKLYFVSSTPWMCSVSQLCWRIYSAMCPLARCLSKGALSSEKSVSNQHTGHALGLKYSALSCLFLELYSTQRPDPIKKVRIRPDPTHYRILTRDKKIAKVLASFF
jgi:hypothetical protein